MWLRGCDVVSSEISFILFYIIYIILYYVNLINKINLIINDYLKYNIL